MLNLFELFLFPSKIGTLGVALINICFDIFDANSTQYCFPVFLFYFDIKEGYKYPLKDKVNSVLPVR